MTEHRISNQHANFLAKRKIFEAALATGVHSGPGLGGAEVIKIPYGQNWFKTYDPGQKQDPWRQIKAKKARLPLWRADQIDFNQTWVLTEGEWDALAAVQVGWRNVVSIPDGAVQPSEESPTKSGKLAAVRDAWDSIAAGNGKVILALDNDECGEATHNALVEMFGRWRCCAIEYPAHPDAVGARGKCKDLNEILLLFGEQALRDVLAKAKPLQLEGVFKPSEIARGTPRKYYDIELPGLEKHLKLFRGELFVLTGITGHGKSTFLWNVLGNLAKKHNLQIGLGTFEAEFWEDIQPWYESWLYANETYDRMTGEINGWEAQPLTQQTSADTTAWMEENFTIISHQVRPLANQASIEWFVQQAADAKGRHGIDVLVLDPWNKLQHKRGGGENEPDYIGRALSELRNFAQVTNTIVIVTAHPTKDAFKADGSIEMPNVSQIHGAMNWGNMADHVVVVFRPEPEKNHVCISVQKSRFKQAGVRGKCWYVFDPDTNRYSVLAKHLWPSE